MLSAGFYIRGGSYYNRNSKIAFKLDKVVLINVCFAFTVWFLIKVQNIKISRIRFIMEGGFYPGRGGGGLNKVVFFACLQMYGLITEGWGCGAYKWGASRQQLTYGILI